MEPEAGAGVRVVPQLPAYKCPDRKCRAAASQACPGLQTPFALGGATHRRSPTESLPCPALPLGAAAGDKPTLRTQPVSQTSGKAFVKQPKSGRPWTKYQLRVCKLVGTVTSECRNLTPECPRTGLDDAETACNILGLAANTRYRVWAKAAKGATQSQESSASDFTTLS